MIREPSDTEARDIPEIRDIALLIGIAGVRVVDREGVPRPLRGTRDDLDRMTEILPPNFDVLRIEGERATRTVILTALYGLIERAAGRQVVIYVSCHGSIVEYGATQHSFLVTNDHPRLEGTFGGILAVELWVAIAKIAERTPFVTVILDCCHAEGIVRGSGSPTPTEQPVNQSLMLKMAEPREFPWPDHLVADYPGHASFRAWLDAIPSDLLDSNGHPFVVRVSASSPEQVAWETFDATGKPGGLLTLELHDLLRRSELPISWQQAIALIRARIARRPRAKLQRPEVAGPMGRFVFGRASEDVAANAAIELDASGTWLLSGRIHGTSRGDRFATRSDRGGVELRVIEVFEDRSRVEASVPVEEGSLAYPRRRARRTPIAIRLDDPDTVALYSLIEGSPLLAPAAAPAALNVASQGQHFAVRDASGRILCLSSRDRLLDNLDACARAEQFAATCSTGPGLPELARWSVGCHRVRHGRTDELAGGELLHIGDRLWFEFHNSSRGGTQLYFNVVELRVDGQARCRNRDYVLAGLPTPAERTRALHYRLGASPGYHVAWPLHTPSDEVLEFALVFVASVRPLDLRAVMGMCDHEPLAIRGSAKAVQDLAWESRVLTLRLAPHPR